MINSFWNICSTCPMPKEEKLNSEYKRNYVWHPQYRPLAQDVINTAPQSVIKEAGMQRRKQYPELAYRNHEVIRHDLGQSLKDATDSRARSEERDLTLASKSGPRSRSADPGVNQHKSIMVQSYPPITAGHVSNLPRTEEVPNISEQPSETSEYQSKFAWPVKSDEEPLCIYRKSVSMNVIKSSEDTVDFVPKSKLAPVHRPCVKHKEAVSTDKPLDSKNRKIKTEYKAKYKPFTSYVYVDGEWKKTSRLLKVTEKVEEDHVEPWFVEVTERLQKANEYRWRGHGHPVYGDAFPDIYKQTPEIPPQRPKRLPVELKLTQPKCHQTSSKKGEASKKKENHSESAMDKKTDKEPRKQSLRRPKSAEPAKAKETVKYKRPATTPPAKLTTQSLPSRKRMPKVEEAEKPKAKTSRKPKEESSAKASSAPKKASSSAPQSSKGKVWLQAGPSSSDPTGKDDPPVKEHSDAVRPSSLSPIKSAVVQQEPPVYNNMDNDKGEVQREEPMSYVPQSTVVPLTHVRTPEEVTGVKSPDPENWTVPIENSERLQWSGANTPDASKLKTPEEMAEKLSKIAVADDEPVPAVAETQESSISNSGKITSGNVLDRARSRLDQFWGKNK